MKIGDKVETSGGHKGTIISWDAQSNMYEIKFDNETLIPPTLFYPATFLIIIIDKCPNCGSEWTITKFNNKIWRDCPTCHKREEDIIKT